MDQESIHISPNPFKGKTTISLSSKVPSNVRIELFDDMGQHIKNIANFIAVSKEYRQDINFSDLKLKTGMYFISISVDGRVTNTKVLYEK